MKSTRNVLLPTISLRAKPDGLMFKTPESAVAKWDKTLSSEKKKDPAVYEMDILGEIGYADWGGTDAKMVKAWLKSAGKAPVILTLNSPGGDAFEGIAIYNLLKDHPAQVTVRVLGLAASAASVIAMAGDRIEMGEAASIMIHSASGLVIGNQEDMRDFAELLDSIDKATAAVYARRTGLAEDEVLDMMRKETWMFTPDAIAKGFADTSFAQEKKDGKAKQSLSSSRSSNAPLASIAALAASRGQRPVVEVRMAVRSTPGASGPLSTSKGNAKMTTKEQIAAFEAKRAAHAARMKEIMQKAGEAGTTLDETLSAEYDRLEADVATIDQHLARLRKHETMELASATVVDTAAIQQRNDAGEAAAAAARGGAAAGGGSGIISVTSNAQKGIAFTRYVKALAMARGNVMQALQIANANKRWKDESPQVAKVLMTAVEGGDTTTAGWASELVYNQNLVNEFIELLRPQTILGRMTGLRQVPFNVRMSGQDSGGTAYWVGQGRAIPASKLHTLEVTLGIAKAAGLMVITEELARSSAPSAEGLIRDDLMKTIKTFLDVQFVDPNVAAVANVSPASITNGVTPIVPTGTDAAALRYDVQQLFKAFIQANMDPTKAVWIMETTQALAISMMLNPLGQPEFPGINIMGGTFQGLPVIPSMSANIAGSPDSGKMIILANADDILMADDGGLTVDASREASIEMTDSPTGDAAAGTQGITSLVSMFQENSIAIKLVRYINWKKRRATAVQYIKEAQYVGSGS